MLEAVVVVGVLLALAVGGFLAYGPITENAKKASVKSAASKVHTGLLVASSDGDPNTDSQNVLDNWNDSTDKIEVEILASTESGDFCVSAENVEDSSITAQSGDCADVTIGGGSPDGSADTEGVGYPFTAPAFSWSGHNWIARDYDTWPSSELGGGPHYNSTEWYSSLVQPQPDGSLKMTLENKGSYPVAAQIVSEDSYGYGTYQMTVTGDFNSFHPGLVFGSMFTYDYTDGPDGGHNEINAAEFSNWSGTGVQSSNNYFQDSGGEAIVSGLTSLPSGSIAITTRMTWQPNKIVWDTFVGSDTNGTRLSHYESTTNVPTPNNEQVNVNLWVKGSDPDRENVPTTSVYLNSFSFTK
jgi:hypothetical protein